MYSEAQIIVLNTIAAMIISYSLLKMITSFKQCRMTGEKIRGFATNELHYQNYHVLYLVKHEKSFEHLRVSQNYQNSNTTADKSTD